MKILIPFFLFLLAVQPVVAKDLTMRSECYPSTLYERLTVECTNDYVHTYQIDLHMITILQRDGSHYELVVHLKSEKWFAVDSLTIYRVPMTALNDINANKIEVYLGLLSEIEKNIIDFTPSP